MNRYQFVLWKKWIGFKRLPPIPDRGKYKGKVYEWRLCLGLFEIRKWGK